MFHRKFAECPRRDAVSAAQVPGWFIFNRCITHDLVTRRQVVLSGVRHASAAPFAPADKTVDEGDGDLVSFMVNEVTGGSDAAPIDGKRFADGPISQVQFPHQLAGGTQSCRADGADFRDGAILSRLI